MSKLNEYRKLRYHKIVDAGLCPRCMEPSDANSIHCKQCKNNRKYSERIKRQTAKGSHKCLNCGKARRLDRTRCDECSAKGSARSAGHGATLDMRQALFNSQRGLCAICEAVLAGPVEKKVHVDHDHVTGRIRGILCHHCNTALGNFRDDCNLLRRALQYLEGGDANDHASS